MTTTPHSSEPNHNFWGSGLGAPRQFDTGANRDTDVGKLDYEGFLSPLVMHAYADYMSKKRVLADGTIRDSDNWQKGMPLAVYMKSLFRHFMDVWAHHRSWKAIALEPLETALVGLMFNTMGYLHETIKARLDAVARAEAEAVLKAKLADKSAAVHVEGEQLEFDFINENVQDFLHEMGAPQELHDAVGRLQAGDTTFVNTPTPTPKTWKLAYPDGVRGLDKLPSLQEPNW